uniref:Uncharacterized protein n=1 Tax=Arundo donax TaxID=35708 RepID=A0A0A9B2H7_ARUDO
MEQGGPGGPTCGNGFDTKELRKMVGELGLPLMLPLFPLAPHCRPSTTVLHCRRRPYSAKHP